MIRIRMERRSKRERAENWTEEERMLLRSLVQEKIDIIENRNTDTATNMHKLEAWKEIWERFILLNQRPRSVQKLREQWKRMKLQSKNMKKKSLQEKDDPILNICNQDIEHIQQPCNESYASVSNGISGTGQIDYKYPRDTATNPKMKQLTTRIFHSKNGIEYKRSMLELNKLVKEQITNCAMEEHQLRMEQLREEHVQKMERIKEMHNLQCENERLKNELMRLEIEIKKKQLHDYVI